MSQRITATLLDAVEKLSVEDQEALVDILRKRIIERRQLEIVAEVHAARAEHAANQSRPIAVSELMKEVLS